MRGRTGRLEGQQSLPGWSGDKIDQRSQVTNSEDKKIMNDRNILGIVRNSQKFWCRSGWRYRH